MKVGIFGAGQLAQMLALAAYPLGIQTLCFTQNQQDCAGLVTKLFLDQNRAEDVLQFAKQVDVVTFENENINCDIVQQIAEICPVFPSAQALMCAQDRLLEKDLFTTLEIPVPPYRAVNSFEELCAAIAEISYPVVLKTRRFGYDGKGQFVLRNNQDRDQAWQKLHTQALIVEAFVNFQFEVSIIAVRDQSGAVNTYPLTRNVHEEGILRLSVAPEINNHLLQQAQQYINRLLTHFDYVGVLALELFCVNTQLFANEMAPRVHNSGHWTIQGAHHSQFENHMRAILGLPLGDTQAICKTAMFNCIGQEPELAEILTVPGAHYQTYGKAPRAARKLAHINLTCVDETLFSERINQIQNILARGVKT